MNTSLARAEANILLSPSDGSIVTHVLSFVCVIATQLVTEAHLKSKDSQHISREKVLPCEQCFLQLFVVLTLMHILRQKYFDK